MLLLIFQVEDQRVANVMGVKVGTYVVKPYLANGESISETIVNRDISIYKEVLLSSSTPSVTAISTKNVNDTSWEHCRIGVVIDAPDDTGTTRVDSSYNHLSDVPDTCGGYNELLEREVMVTDDSYVKQESANKCSGRNGCLTSNCKPNEGSLEEICDCQKPSPVEPIAVKCTQFVGPKESGIENSFPHLPLSLEEGGHLSPCGSFDRNEMGLRNLLLEGDGSTLGILGTLNNHLMTSPITFQQHFEGDSLPQDLDENVEPAVAL